MLACLPTSATRPSDLRRIGPVVALVVAAHAVLLALPRQAPAASGSPAAVAQALQFRLLPVPAHEAAAPSVTAFADSAVRKTLEPLPDAPPVTSEPLAPSPQPAVAAAAVPLVPTAPNWLGVALPGVANDDDRYFARSLLSVAPAPLQPVIIDYPVFDGDAGRYVSELSLFIDETGAVVKVRVDGDALPPPLEAAARTAFLNARFRPGESAEHGVVKSRIRVEVVFDGPAAPSGG